MGAWGYNSQDCDSAWDIWSEVADKILSREALEAVNYDYKKALKKKVTAANAKKLEKALVKSGEKHRKRLAKSNLPLIQQAAAEWNWFPGVALHMKAAGFKLSAKLKATCRSLLEDELSTFQVGKAKLNLAGWKDPKKRISAIKRELRLLK
jgi:hypothetical protein